MPRLLLPLLLPLAACAGGKPDDTDTGAPVTDTDTAGTDTDTHGADTDTSDTDTSDTDTSDTDTDTDTNADTTPADACADLPLCDGFEDAAAGGPPDAARWSVVSPDCSGTGTVTVDDAVAHGGARSLRVDGGGGYCDHVFVQDTAALAAIGGPIHARFYVRFATALGEGHTSFLALPDANDGGAALRMGGQAGIFMWNRASDDATLPVLSPAGIATSFVPEPERWYCVEVAVDEAGTLDTWVDGVAIEGLRVDGEPTPDIDAAWLERGGWAPAPTALQLGWESYHGDTMTLWLDDVAVAGAPIGCE